MPRGALLALCAILAAGCSSTAAASPPAAAPAASTSLAAVPAPADRLAELRDGFERTWILLDEASRDPEKARVVSEVRSELRDRVARLERVAADLPATGQAGVARGHYLAALGFLREATDEIPGALLGHVWALRTALDRSAEEWRAGEAALRAGP